MSHALYRIKSSLANKPHLIEATSFNSIIEYLSERNAGNIEIPKPEAVSEGRAGSRWAHLYNDHSQTGIMTIDGPLTYRTSGWEALCGGTSYEMLKEQMEHFVDAGARTVAMIVDSGGGEAHGMMDSANYIRKLADDNGIKIIAYVDGISASAAYGISSIADEIVMSSDSMVGSIGVLIQLINNSEALKKAGYERTFVTAGKDKVPYDEDGGFTEAFIDGLQEQVDELYVGFTNHVAGHRGMDVQVVRDTEANMFMAQQALDIGLADSVMTVEEFHEYLSVVALENMDEKAKSAPSKRAARLAHHQTEEANMAQLEELQTQLNEQSAQLNEALAAIAALTDSLAVATASLADAEKAKADAALASRKAALSEVLPEDQVEAKLSQYGSIDQATFDFIYGELKATKDARAASFAAIGQDAPVTEEDEEQHDATAELRQKGIEAAKARRR